MPVVLTQHYSPRDRVYEDVEFSLYHYPRVYFARVEAYDRFIYYRPLGKSHRRPDSMHYFGYGVLGPWFADARSSNHRFVPLISALPFQRLVSIRDEIGHSYEPESATLPQFVSSVRRISETAYHRILAEARATTRALSEAVTTEAVSAFYLPGEAAGVPRDRFRRINEVPPGAGYVPNETTPDVFESAALQERARADHQHVLSLVLDRVHARGGTCAYNNNVDLLVEFGPSTQVLVEAKSLNDVRDAVDRMRYGLGQLADYTFRYKADLPNATPMLAFGRAPDRQTAWIADVLEENRIGFIANVDDRLRPLNAVAEASPLLR